MSTDTKRTSIDEFFKELEQMDHAEVEAFSRWAGPGWESREPFALLDRFNALKVGLYLKPLDFAEEKRDELLSAAASELRGQGGLSGGPALKALRELGECVDLDAYFNRLVVDYDFFYLDSGGSFFVKKGSES